MVETQIESAKELWAEIKNNLGAEGYGDTTDEAAMLKIIANFLDSFAEKIIMEELSL